MAARGRNISGIIIKLGADNSELSAAISESYKQAKGLETELKKVNAALKIDPKNSLFQGQKIEVLKDSITATERKLKDLKQAQEVAAEAFASGKMSADRYREIERQVELTETELKSLRAELQRQESSWVKAGDAMQKAGTKIKGIGDGMQKFGWAATKNVTAPLTAIGTVAVKSAVDFESAMAGVRKTTELTDEEFAAMAQGIRDMAKTIPASTEEIAAVAEAAGQLGIKKDSILDFTRVIVDMGNSTNLSAEQGATQMARFANIIGMSQKDFSRLGSAIVDLGNNYATTESEIMDMAMRLAGAGKQAKMSEGDVLGIAAALSSLGLEAQAGGSAFSKAMAMIQVQVETGGDKLEDFARIAGMSAKDFSELWVTNAAEALNRFVVGLGNVEEHGASATVLLDELGIKQLNMSDALKRTSGAQDIMTDAIKLGNEAWRSNNALTNEANQRYATSASQLEVQKNRMKDAAIELGQKLIPYVIDFVEFLTDLIEKFSSLDSGTQETIVKLGLLAAAIGPVTKVVGGLVSTVGSITTAVGKAATAIGGKAGLATALGGLASPLGIVVGAGIALPAIIGAMGIESDNTSKKIKELGKELETAGKKLEESTGSIETQATEAFKLTKRLEELNKKSSLTTIEQTEMEGIVRKLNEQMPDLNLSIEEQTRKLNLSTDAVKAYIREWMKTDLIKEYREEINENLKRLEEAEENLVRARENHAKAEQEILDTKLWAQTTYNKEDAAEAVRRAEQKAEQAKNDIELAEKTKDDIIKVSEEYVKKIEGIDGHLDKLWGSMTGNRKDYIDSERDAVEDLNDLAAQEQKDREEAANERSRALSQLEQDARSHNEKMFNIENEGITQSKLTLKKATENLHQQARDYESWADNMRKLAGKVPIDVLAELAKLGPGQGQLVAELVKATPKQVEGFVEAWRHTGRISKQSAAGEFNGIIGSAKQTVDSATDVVREGRDSMFRAGQYVGQGFVSGYDLGTSGASRIGASLIDGLKTSLSKAAPSLYTVGGNIMNETIRRMKNVAMVKSPSRATAEIGQMMGEGLIVGFDGMTSKVASTAGGLTASALEAMRVLGDPLSGANWSKAAGEFDMPDTVLQTKRFDITGNQFIVREEADIQRIAHELNRLIRREERSLT